MGGTRDVVRGIGLSLFPAGVVAFILSRFAASITEILLRETVRTTIRDRLEEDMKDIKSTVDRGLNQIDEDMKGLLPLFISSSKMGLENVLLNRGAALEAFAKYLNAELERPLHGESARVWIVCSSFKEFLETSGTHFDGQKMIDRIVQSGCDLRIIMTDPKMGVLRSRQEHRSEGEIQSEINMNIARLKNSGVRREVIRYYPGTPTVFAIATTERMWLNPYPYQREAFRCFSLIVYKTLDPENDIYHQYLRYHFEEPWERATEVPLDEWNKL
jgi:hypothetical protein